MKMYCRFAPPAAASAAVMIDVASPPQCDGAAEAGWKAEVTLRDPSTGSSACFTCDGAFLPATWQYGVDQSRAASFSPLENSLPLEKDDALGDGVDRSEQARVYSAVCQPFFTSEVGAAKGAQAAAVAEAPKARHVLLAYGQTSTGKTHSLFGSFAAQQRAEQRSRHASSTSDSIAGPPPHRNVRAGSALWWGAQLRSPAAGLVPRFLADLFRGRHFTEAGVLFVDVACFEIYNEVTTDLVAVAVEGDGQPEQRPSRRAAPHASRASARGSSASVPHANSGFLDDSTCGSDADGDEEDEITVEELTAPAHPSTGAHPSRASGYRSGVSSRSANRSADFSVAAAWRRYRHAERAAASSPAQPPLPPTTSAAAGPRATFKATEKGQVLDHVQRARCGSAVEAWVVLNQLLALRRRSETARNVSSSRGHLLVRFEAYVAGSAAHRAAPAPAPPVMASESLFCDLAGSESHRGLSAIPISTPTTAHRPPPLRRTHSATSSLCNSSFNGTGGELTDTDSLCTVGTIASSSSAPARRRQCRRRASSNRFDKTERQRLEAARAEAAVRGREMRNINTSLLALRKVIHAFHVVSSADGPPRRPYTDGRVGSGGVHAPFKDSALTTILEPFLLPRMSSAGADVGDTHVALLVCCSSRQADFHETISSLRLGAAAISVKPHIVAQAFPQLMSGATGARASHRYHRTHSAPVLAPAALHRQGGQPRAPQREDVPTRSTGTQTRSQEAEGSSHGTATEAALQHRVDTMAEELRSLRRGRAEQDRIRAQLTAQFASICAHYKECVEELSAVRAREESQKADMRRLQALVDEQQRALVEARMGKAEDTPWTTGKAVDVSPSSPCDVDHGRTEEAGRPRAALFPPPPPLSDSSDEARHSTGESAPLARRTGRAPPALLLPPAPPTVPSPPQPTPFMEVTNHLRRELSAGKTTHPHPVSGAAEEAEPEGDAARAEAENVVPIAAPCRVYKL